jgi:hypothetical protein
MTGVAPADEYFGKLKLSFLGIDNTFKDAAIRSGQSTIDPSIANAIDWAIDALNDWQHKYPNDPQLARSYFLGQQTMKKLWMQKYQEKAWLYMQHIMSSYPNTFFGKQIKAEVAKGYTQHYFAEAKPCGPEGPVPVGTAAPAVDHGKYKVQIEPAPCYTPAPTPSPTPTATPTPEPTLAPEASPLVPVPFGASPEPGVSAVPLPGAPSSPSPFATPEPAPIPSASFTPVPSLTPIPSPVPLPSSLPAPSQSATPALTPQPVQTLTPPPAATPAALPTPWPSPFPSPTAKA